MPDDLCPDCGGPLRPGLLYGTAPKPVRCSVCWRCGWQTEAVYRRTKTQRNCEVYHSAADCVGCGALLVAKRPLLLRAYCDACYAAGNNRRRVS